MKKLIIIIFMLSVTTTFSQIEADINNILDDMILYAKHYSKPATENSIYQASTSWMQSAKLKKEWKFNLSLNTKIFFVPNSERNFDLKNSDLKIFKIENVVDDKVIQLPTIYGGDTDVRLVANTALGDFKARVDGVNREQVIYPYFQAGISLPYGLEFMARYSPSYDYKKTQYQIYGLALQYNLNQHFQKLNENKINLATLISYNYENISNNYLDTSGSTLSLGIESLNSKINSFHWQINASKEFKKFEIMTGLSLCVSDVKYKFFGSNNGDILGVDAIFNERAKTSLDNTKLFFFGELSGRYNVYRNLYLQSTFSLGNNFSSNLGIQYEFN